MSLIFSVLWNLPGTMLVLVHVFVLPTQTLLAQKYGYRPLPMYIPEEEYGQLCAVMEDAAGSRRLVQQWYKLDTNAEPPQYVLQPLQEQ